MQVGTLIASSCALLLASALWCSPSDVFFVGWLLALTQLAIGLRRRSYHALLACLTVVSVVTTHWPLRATFWLARHQLEEIAKTIAPGSASEHTVWFHNVRAEVNVIGWHCIWVGRGRSGRRGFVKGSDLARKLSIAYVGHSIILDKDWAFFSEE